MRKSYSKGIAILISMAAGSGAAWAKGQPPDLFLPWAAARAAGGSEAEAASQPVKFNAEALLALPEGQEAQVTLPRLGTLAIVHDRTERSVSGNVTWIGYFKGYGTDYRVIITTGPNGSAGRISSPDGEFTLTPGAGNDWLLDRKQAGFQGVQPSEDDGLVPPPKPAANPARQGKPATANAAAAGNSIIDLMIVYTPGMAQRYGAGLQSRLDTLVAIANQAYIDSGVAITLRLVHSVQVNYSDSTPLNTALNELTNGTGPFAGIPALRSQYSADLVHLIRPYYPALGSCGLGWLGSATPDANYGYSVSEDGDDVAYVPNTPGTHAYCYDISMTHELGHNMGAAHDRAHAGGGAPAFSYSYGYGIEKPSPAAFATIMATGYINADPVAKFSNPGINCGPNSLPCGVAASQPNSADNAQTLNNTRTAIAAFSDSPTGVSVSLTAVPTALHYGGATTLNWSSTNASSCSATTSWGWSGEIPLNGFAVLTQVTDTTYTVTCLGTGGAGKTATVTVTVNPDRKECLFDWAETFFPGLFAPTGALTQSLPPYVYRHYTNTNSYVGVSSSNNHVYYLGPTGGLLDVGDLSGWLTTSNCQ